MKFTRQNATLACGALFLLIVIYAVLHPLSTAYEIAELMVRLGPAPKYDLLFSIDFNDIPYANPNSTGLVIDPQAGIERLITERAKECADAQDFAVQNEAGLASLIRPLDTPAVPQTTRQSRPKE